MNYIQSTRLRRLATAAFCSAGVLAYVYAAQAATNQVSTSGTSGLFVHIGDGDCTAFNNAAASVADGSSKTVVLKTKGNYKSETSGSGGCFIDLPRGNLTVDAAGAELTVNYICGLGFTAEVGSEATLTLRNLHMVNTSDEGCMGTAATAKLRNSGNLFLENVTLENVGLENLGSGSTVLRNVTWHKGSFFGAGSLGSFNSTLSAVDLQVADAKVVMSNSLLANSSCTNLTSGSVQSLGGNMATDVSCKPIANDHVISGIQLDALADNGGLVPTIALTMTSPARRIGVEAYCETTDARGETRFATTCDAGAYEFGGGQSKLTAGGMNGTFYNRTYNGSYIYIQRLDRGDALVTWTTFDNKGNPAWVYGVATVSGTHLHTDASENLDGVLQPGSGAVGYHATPWGSIDIDLKDCDNGTFTYKTNLPQFGSGTFPLLRLANIGGLNCSE